jgi:hypothetical protein
MASRAGRRAGEGSRFRYAARVKSGPRRLSGRVVAVAVMVLGVAVGSAGIWWMSRSRPEPGAYIDVLALGGDAAVAVRRERSGARSFVELIDGGRARWNALVPRYADPPSGIALAASTAAITVRVVRGGLPEVFALDARDAAKLGGIHLAASRPPHRTGYTLPVAATVNVAGVAIEVIGDDGVWAELVGVRQQDGKPAWRQPLGAVRVDSVSAPPGTPEVSVRQGARTRVFAAATGALIADRTGGTDATSIVALLAGAIAFTYDPSTRALTAVDDERALARIRWPADARAPQPHNAAEGALWMVLPDRLVLLNPRSLAVMTAVGGPAPALESLPITQ